MPERGLLPGLWEAARRGLASMPDGEMLGDRIAEQGKGLALGDLRHLAATLLLEGMEKDLEFGERVARAVRLLSWPPPPAPLDEIVRETSRRLRRDVEDFRRGSGAYAEEVPFPIDADGYEDWIARFARQSVYALDRRRPRSVPAAPPPLLTPELVNGFRRGDEEAARQVFERLEPSLRRQRMVARLGRADAEEVVQETFARALERKGSLHEEPAHFGGWFHLTARNLAVDRLRRPSVAALVGADGSEVPFDPADRRVGVEERVVEDSEGRDALSFITDAIAIFDAVSLVWDGAAEWDAKEHLFSPDLRFRRAADKPGWWRLVHVAGLGCTVRMARALEANDGPDPSVAEADPDWIWWDARRPDADAVTTPWDRFGERVRQVIQRQGGVHPKKSERAEADVAFAVWTVLADAADSQQRKGQPLPLLADKLSTGWRVGQLHGVAFKLREGCRDGHAKERLTAQARWAHEIVRDMAALGRSWESTVGAAATTTSRAFAGEQWEGQPFVVTALSRADSGRDPDGRFANVVGVCRAVAGLTPAPHPLMEVLA